MSDARNRYKKYLQGYAEPEINCLSDFPLDQNYQNCIVIPAYLEKANFIQRFINSHLANGNVLFILVINQPQSIANNQLQLALAKQCTQSGEELWQHENLSLIQMAGKTSRILLIDRYHSSRAIPDNQGVGLARKIGADVACFLIDKSIIDSPWICSSDADTHLPDNYFSALASIPDKTAAITYQFCHINNNDALSDATLLYEKALRYYVCGLQWAGSHYAFHTIGSTLAFRYDYYALARGFPKRAAGEDFYLLNKLAKLAPVRNVSDVTLLIESRLSDRVPFGTGPAASKILQLTEIESYQYYHPQLFIELKNCLIAMKSLWEERNNFQLWMSKLSEPSQYALTQLPFEKLTMHIMKHIPDKQQCDHHIEQWFDGFRTLKFIHHLQSAYFSPITLAEAIKRAPFQVS